MDNIITTERIEAYCLSLLADERSAGTISKYHRDLTAFSLWLDGRAVTKETAAGWKSHLSHRGYAPCTVNSMLAAVNGFCHFMAWHIKVKFLKIQRQIFRDSAKELTKEEYDRLLTAARESGQERLVLIMETLCATGIRVSELRYITVEAAKAGRATITLKGKIRTILLPTKLCRKLVKYARKQKIAAGEIFSQAAGRAFRGGRCGLNSSGCARRQGWSRARCSRTICGTCSPPPSTGPSGTSCALRICWAIPASTPPAFT